MIIFRPPTEADLQHVAASMRAMDALECRVLSDGEPIDALREGVEQSLWCFAAEIDGQVVCVFGVACYGFTSDEGSPWLLGVEGMERYARELLIGTRAYLGRMREEFETLSNWVHANNRNAIRYLKWCGFEFGEELLVDGEPFLPFSMVCSREMKKAA